LSTFTGVNGHKLAQGTWGYTSKNQKEFLQLRFTQMNNGECGSAMSANESRARMGGICAAPVLKGSCRKRTAFRKPR